MDHGKLQKTFAALYEHTRCSRISSSSPSKTKGLHKTLAKGARSRIQNKFYY